MKQGRLEAITSSNVCGLTAALPSKCRACSRIGNCCQSRYLSSVPTRNISLTPEQDAFIGEMLKAGKYRNASEAVRDAIRALQQRRAEEALKLDNLRVTIQQGIAALDRGDFTEVADEDLD